MCTEVLSRGIPEGSDFHMVVLCLGRHRHALLAASSFSSMAAVKNVRYMTCPFPQRPVCTSRRSVVFVADNVRLQAASGHEYGKAEPDDSTMRGREQQHAGNHETVQTPQIAQLRYLLRAPRPELLWQSGAQRRQTQSFSFARCASHFGRLPGTVQR